MAEPGFAGSIIRGDYGGGGGVDPEMQRMAIAQALMQQGGGPTGFGGGVAEGANPLAAWNFYGAGPSASDSVTGGHSGFGSMGSLGGALGIGGIGYDTGGAPSSGSLQGGNAFGGPLGASSIGGGLAAQAGINDTGIVGGPVTGAVAQGVFDTSTPGLVATNPHGDLNDANQQSAIEVADLANSPANEGLNAGVIAAGRAATAPSGFRGSIATPGAPVTGAPVSDLAIGYDIGGGSGAGAVGNASGAMGGEGVGGVTGMGGTTGLGGIGQGADIGTGGADAGTGGVGGSSVGSSGDTAGGPGSGSAGVGAGDGGGGGGGGAK